jgi:hypothetical protein
MAYSKGVFFVQLIAMSQRGSLTNCSMSSKGRGNGDCGERMPYVEKGVSRVIAYMYFMPSDILKCTHYNCYFLNLAILISSQQPN